MCSLPAHLCSALGHFLSCLGQPGLLATFSFLERGHLPSGRPVSTYLVLLFKRQQLAQESAPRGLSLKLAGVIPSEGRHYLVLLTPYISPGGMPLNTGQRSALLSGGLPHFSEPQVGTVIILSLMDTCIAYLKLTINLSLFVCEYVHTCVHICVCVTMNLFYALYKY